MYFVATLKERCSEFTTEMGSSTTTPISSTNIGFQLLKKHGWKEGTGLGASEQGRLEPIQTYLKKDKGGLGCDEVFDGTTGKGIRCEICKIDCNSRDVFEKHMLGKKHKRNVHLMQIVPPAIFPSPLPTIPNQSLMQMTLGEEFEIENHNMLEDGASADSIFFCTICNVVCNSQAVLINHLSGKKHAAQVLENANAGNENIDSAEAIVEQVLDGQQTNKGEVVDLTELKSKMMSLQTLESEDIETKKRKIVEGGAAESDIRVCVLCNVVCNSQAVFMTHLSGRKHAAQVLESSNASSGNTDSTLLIVEPKVDNMEMKGDVVNSDEFEKKTAATQEPPDLDDIETKKRKIVEGGAAESDIRVCMLCNVVCNSPSVFKFHLTGQKHTTMVKNQAEAEKNKANSRAALELE